jgi:hypothetical protein
LVELDDTVEDELDTIYGTTSIDEDNAQGVTFDDPYIPFYKIVSHGLFTIDMTHIYSLEHLEDELNKNQDSSEESSSSSESESSGSSSSD